MPRIRTVKPRLFQHSGLFDAEHETGLPLRLAYIGLFTCCDREGRFKWDERELKLHVLPWDEIDFSRVLDALVTRGFVVRYACESGEEYGAIPTFTHHQVINNRETASEIPPPPESLVPHGLATREPRVDDARGTRTQGKGREGKGKEGKGKEVNRRLGGDGFSRAREQNTATHVPDRASLAAAEIAIALRTWERERGKAARGVMASHPHVIELAELHVSDAELRRAYDAAVADRDATGDATPVNAGFVRVFVDKHRHPPKPREDNGWRRTPSGIERKASELGIVCPPGRDHTWLAEKCESVMRQHDTGRAA